MLEGTVSKPNLNNLLTIIYVVYFIYALSHFKLDKLIMNSLELREIILFSGSGLKSFSLKIKKGQNTERRIDSLVLSLFDLIQCVE